MNFVIPDTTENLLQNAINQGLYEKLIQQLIKDFNLANQLIEIDVNSKPDDLKNKIQDKVYNLIQNKFVEYLNLLYIIDVPEDQTKSINSIDFYEISEQITFLILKREWLKVWYRNNY